MTTRNGVLIAHGRLGWDRLVEVVGDASCAWQDLDGWNVGPCPALLPDGATHVWAWSDARLFVARTCPDGEVVAAELALGDTGDVGVEGGTGREEVVYMRSRAMGWAAGELRVDEAVTGLDGEQYVVDGPAPLVFVRLDGAGGGDDGA